jgi:hypothetical protein
MTVDVADHAAPEGLPEFLRTPKCPKCGVVSIGAVDLRWCKEARGRAIPDDCWLALGDHAAYTSGGVRLAAEHMHRTCQHCGYQFAQKPLG